MVASRAARATKRINFYEKRSDNEPTVTATIVEKKNGADDGASIEFSFEVPDI